MKKRTEKSFHIRLNLEKATDRDIYEWLKAKEENQTISINAFVIEGLRKLKLAEIRSDTSAVPMTEAMYSLRQQASPETVRNTDGTFQMEEGTDSGETGHGAEGVALSEEVMDFLDGF